MSNNYCINNYYNCSKQYGWNRVLNILARNQNRPSMLQFSYIAQYRCVFNLPKVIFTKAFISSG